MFSRTKSHAVFTLALALLLTASIEFRLQSAALASAGQNLPLGAATPFKKMFFAPEAQRRLAGGGTHWHLHQSACPLLRRSVMFIEPRCSQALAPEERHLQWRDAAPLELRT